MINNLLSSLFDDAGKGVILKILMTISKKEDSSEYPVKAKYIARIAEELQGGKSDPSFDFILGYQMEYGLCKQLIKDTWSDSQKDIFKMLVINLVKYQDNYIDEELKAVKMLFLLTGIKDENFNMLYSIFLSEF
jgi:hypothetical protein